MGKKGGLSDPRYEKQGVEPMMVMGWRQIALMLGLSEATVMRRKQKLMDAGVIFRIRVGSPPKPRIACIPARLESYLAQCGKDGRYF